MFLNQILNPKPTAYSEAIAEATGAHRMEVPIIERIMREVIFHSTLDWQSQEQFASGAIEAYAEYKAFDQFYDAQHKFMLYGFHRAMTGDKLEQAVAKLDRATLKRVPARITKLQAEVEKLQKKKAKLDEKTGFYEKYMLQMSRIYAGEPTANL